VDSATMMNKGLEFIEARWLFGIDADKIKVLIHPQSIVHSMVEFEDGSVLAQLGAPDMRVPIQYALTHPERAPNDFNRADFLKSNALTFEEPDYDTFECLALAEEALKIGGTMPAVMNMANERAVALFLAGELKFLEISSFIKQIMGAHKAKRIECAVDITEAEKWVNNII